MYHQVPVTAFRVRALPGAQALIQTLRACFRGPVVAKRAAPAGVRFAVARFRAAAAKMVVRDAQVAFLELGEDRDGAFRAAAKIPVLEADHTVAALRFGQGDPQVCPEFWSAAALNEVIHWHHAWARCVQPESGIRALERGFVPPVDSRQDVQACPDERPVHSECVWATKMHHHFAVVWECQPGIAHRVLGVRQRNHCQNRVQGQPDAQFQARVYAQSRGIQCGGLSPGARFSIRALGWLVSV